MEQVTVFINGTPYAVIGGDFWSMLGRIKAIPSRSYSRKVWSLPLSLEDARSQLAPLQVVTEDELLDAEIADIQRVQTRLIELTAAIEKRTQVLDKEVARYSYRSKSSIKAGLAHDSSLLFHALEDARIPSEKLTEPQIKTMHAALRLLEE